MKRLIYSLIAAAVVILGGARTDAANNLLANDGFESPSIGASGESGTEPSGWIVFSSVTNTENVGLSGSMVRTGKQAARVTAQGVAGSYQGLFQALSVDPGTAYEFRIYVRNDKDKPMQNGMRGQISIEWKDAHDGEIGRVWGPSWSPSLFSAHWVPFEVSAKAPPNAAKAHFVVTQFDGKDTGTTGSFLLDDASVTQRQ